MRLTGLPLAESYASREEGELPCRLLALGLLPSDRSVLHERIARRFELMLEEGLVAEVEGLRRKYRLSANLPSMRCVGYRQAWQFLDGEIGATQLLETGLAATRQLAKRQLTWLRSTPGVIEIDCLSSNLAQRVLKALTD